ncbi:MAG: serine/threonine-protein phosphatase [Myxococcales bacterium]|nr:serine/threonine-protein phosphatase [Myxococcales bacterium]
MTTLAQSESPSMPDHDSKSARTQDADAEVQLRSAMLTDVGVVRDHNEDSATIDDDMRFFVVADGMGGHAAGEIASAMAVEGVRRSLTGSNETIEEFSKNPDEDGRQQIAQVLEDAVREAHRSVYERGIAEPDKQGMGTTLDVLLVAGQDAFIAHVGDSRTYLMRGDHAAQITSDHTVAEELVVVGKLSAEEALVSPLRTILVNALGVAAEIGVEMAHLTLHEGDRLLLCSDGLHDYFPQEQELFDEVTSKEPEAALTTLIDAAKERGGQDNITAVLIEVLKAPEVEEVETIPVPIVRGTSDGIPHAITKDDTMPVDILGEANPVGAIPLSDAPPPDRGAADCDAGEAQDLRSTIPLRGRPARSRSTTREGMGTPREFSGEPTVEIDPNED